MFVVCDVMLLDLMSLPCACSKDVRIPQELRRVMAAEAEAAREAKAKVSTPAVLSWCEVHLF